jgi:hypothetical protein
MDHTAELLRNVADLRDGTHGAAARQGKERFLRRAPMSPSIRQESDPTRSC